MPRLTVQSRRTLVEERKAQILSAAAKVFAEKGFERATIAEIAKQAGVSPGLIYTYFKNKGDLLVSIPRQYVQPVIEHLQAETMFSDTAEHVSSEHVLDLVAHHLVRTVTEHGDILRVMLTSLPTMSPATRTRFLEQAPLLALNMLQTYFGQQISAGVFRRDLDPEITARIFPGMLWVFLMLREVLQLPLAANFDDEQVIEHVKTIFLSGVLARPETRHTTNPARKRLRA